MSVLKEVLVCFETVERKKGEVKQCQATEVEQYGPNPEAGTCKTTGQLGTVGKDGSKECPEKYEPENRDNKFKKNGRVGANSLHIWC